MPVAPKRVVKASLLMSKWSLNPPRLGTQESTMVALLRIIKEKERRRGGEEEGQRGGEEIHGSATGCVSELDAFATIGRVPSTDQGGCSDIGEHGRKGLVAKLRLDAISTIRACDIVEAVPTVVQVIGGKGCAYGVYVTSLLSLRSSLLPSFSPLLSFLLFLFLYLML